MALLADEDTNATGAFGDIGSFGKLLKHVLAIQTRTAPTVDSKKLVTVTYLVSEFMQIYLICLSL